MQKCHILEKSKLKIINFQREDDEYFIQPWSDNALKGTIVNLTCFSKICESLEITSSFPLISCLFRPTSYWLVSGVVWYPPC